MRRLDAVAGMEVWGKGQQSLPRPAHGGPERERRSDPNLRY